MWLYSTFVLYQHNHKRVDTKVGESRKTLLLIKYCDCNCHWISSQQQRKAKQASSRPFGAGSRSRRVRSPGHGSATRNRPEVGRGYPLNLSILLSGGRETNEDSLSNGEWSGKSPSSICIIIFMLLESLFCMWIAKVIYVLLQHPWNCSYYCT